MTETIPSLETDEAITIRRADSVDDYRACQDAQRRAWGVTEDGYLVPIATMVGANLHGGLVLGAFLPGGEAVAMSFAFLGRIEGRLGLYSQLTGVVPGYQSRGLGYRIKLHQRDFARSEGIDVIAWAFDPLQAGNAHFNLARLGATAGRYIDNMYGERTDALNAGVPTDRLIAEWDMKSELDASLPASDDASKTLPRMIDTTAGMKPGETPAPNVDTSVIGEPRILLEIPTDIARLRREQPGSSEQWRTAVRSAFRAAFDSGYRATDFVREDSGGTRRGFYLLESREAAPLAHRPETV